MGSGGEDMAGRAVIALEPHDLRAGEVVLEAQDVIDLRAAPAIDRLVVVTDAAQVLRARLPALRQQPQPEILGDIGVLILVHQHVAETTLILGEDFRVLPPKAQRLQQQIAEIGGVERLQPLLIGSVKRAAAPVGEGGSFPGRHLVGREAPVLPAVNPDRELASRPALLVDVGGLDHLLHQADLVIHIEDREIRFQADELRVTAQDFGADRVERAEPGHAFRHGAQQSPDPFLHLTGGLVGEGHRENVGRPGAPGGDEMGDARGEHARLAGTGAGKHEQRPVERLDRLALLGVQAGEIGGIAHHGGAGTRGQSTAFRRRRRGITARRCAGLGIVGKGHGHPSPIRRFPRQGLGCRGNATRICIPGMGLAMAAVSTALPWESRKWWATRNSWETRT